MTTTETQPPVAGQIAEPVLSKRATLDDTHGATGATGERTDTRAPRKAQHLEALKVAVLSLRRERAALTRERRTRPLTETEDEKLRDLEQEIHRLEAKLTPPPGAEVMARLEALAERVLEREGQTRGGSQNG